MKPTCIIVEDEPIGQEIIRSYLLRDGSFEILGQFKNAIEASAWLQANTAHVIFLDIRMPRMNGLDFLRSLLHPPKVIITSAYREYAIDAFDLEVVDYLLKPISFERFRKAIGKVLPRSIPADPEPIAPDRPFVFVKGNKQLQKVYFDDILYIESQRDYVKIKLVGGQEASTRQTISYYEQFLPAQLFLRVHRSYIVAVRKVTALEAVRVLIGKTSIPIGRNYRQVVADLLKPTA